MTDVLSANLTSREIDVLNYAQYEDFLETLNRLASEGVVQQKVATRVKNGIKRSLNDRVVAEDKVVVYLATERDENLHVRDMIGLAGIGVINITIKAMINKQ